MIIESHVSDRSGGRCHHDHGHLAGFNCKKLGKNIWVRVMGGILSQVGMMIENHLAVGRETADS